MKKKAIIVSICAAVALLLIVLATILLIALKKDYLEKLPYDHVAPVSYNGVSIVGEDGLFYLVKDGEKLSDGYVFLQSVNDYYDDIEAAGAKKDSDLVLFDYYLAHRADSATYYLVTSTGEEYTIMGDNYSIESITLPYIIFINNTTSRKAAISLLKVDSDLSYKSGTDIILKPFSTVEPIISNKKVLSTQLFVTDEASDKKYSLFCDDGTLIVSAEHMERMMFSDGYDKTLSYCLDLDENAVYSPRGELLAKGSEPLKRVSELFGTMLRYDEKLGANVLEVFSVNGKVSLTDAEYDLASAKFYKGAIILPVRNKGGFDVINAINGEKHYCLEAAMRDDGIIFAKSGEGEYTYFTDCAEVLVTSVYTDLVLLPTLSTGNSYVFSSESHRVATSNANSYYFTRVGYAAVTMSFDANASLAMLSANDGAELVEGSFLVSKLAQNSAIRMEHRICTPFAANPLSDAFDTVDTYLQADIYWSRCASYERGNYDIIDPISNQKAGSILCEGEDFARLSFAFEGYELMVTDNYDEESGIPVLILSIRRYEDNEGTTSNVHYYALYRSIYASSKSFDKGTLKISEIGMNFLRTNPFTFFPHDNCLVLNGIGASRVFRFNDSNILAEVASMPYRVTDVIYDKADPTLLYYLVESEGGNKGLYDKDGNSILAPYYNEIYSLENGRFVVSLRGGVGVLEYRNSKIRQIIDYSYCSITAFSDGGYLAIDGNEKCVLYEGDKIIVKDPIQSANNIIAYSIAEDGTLNVRFDLLVSVDGDLYVHKSSVSHKPKCSEFEKVEIGYENIENTRAKLINYYVDGKLSHTDTVYPTEFYGTVYAIQPSVDQQGWFFSKESAEQITPITKDDLLNYPEYIISLYPKAFE